MSIEVASEGRVLRVALNRPSHRNLLTIDMARSLVDAIEHAQSDEAVGAVLLEGRGEFFCYGSDPDLPEAIWTLCDRLTKPLIAAVQGAALGAGVALVAHSHVAVAAQGTSFGLLEIRNRTFPLALHAVAKAIGWRRARELALTSRVCSTPEALQMALVHEVAPAFEYEQRSESVAQMLAEADPGVVSRILMSRQST
jgi:enoyl-CoA hydratase/carnithine racemase